MYVIETLPLKQQQFLMIQIVVVTIFLAILFIFNLSAEPILVDDVLAVPTLRDANLKVETVATGLDLPTSMAFIGPNDILVLEKNKGTVQRVKDGVVLPQPLLDVNVASNSERGMLGVDVVQVPTPILPPSARLFNVFL